MEIFALFAFLIVGMAAGFIAGMLGLSGGVVMVPCLLFLFRFLDFPQAHVMHMAIGTALSAMVMTGIAATWTHHKHKGVMWSIAMLMLPGIVMGCTLGTFVAQFLSGFVLQLIFGLFICMLGAFVLFHKGPSQKKKPKPVNSLYTWFGFGIGSFASLLGIGGGVFTVPLLISYQFSEQKSIGTSAAVGTMVTIIASIGYLYFGLSEVAVPMSLGFIYLPAFAMVSLGTVIFAMLGAKLAHRMEGKKLKRIFAGVLLIVGILMIFN
ncbi:MAG: sulfite exporter TauE/SafE family protein [Simkaniaceae bacterium]|nr:sulfite exporter TauE/SafE family protein [Candidatus Sacchlamyda saccharinae]